VDQPITTAKCWGMRVTKSKPATAADLCRTRTDWLAFFRKHYSSIRPLVSFLGGSQLGNKLDRFKDIGDAEPAAIYLALAAVLHEAIAAVSASDVDYMTGWDELAALCDAHAALLSVGKVNGGRKKTEAGCKA